MAPLLLLTDSCLNSSHAVQRGARRERHAHHLALAGAHRRQVVVGGQRGAHVGGGHAVGGHLLRVEPGPQREGARTQDLGGLHARNGVELGLHHAHQEVGDVVVGQRVAVEADVHRIGGLARGHREHRLLRLGRQLVAHRIDLRVDLGQRAVGVVVQPQRGRDGRHAQAAGRRQVVDALRLRHGRLQRLRDEARHRGRVGPVVRGADGDHAVLGLGVLVDRQAGQRTQPQHHDQQAHHHRQHGPADEDVGEVHAGSLTFPAASGSRRWSAARCCPP
jgi:hypothetical protein